MYNIYRFMYYPLFSCFLYNRAKYVQQEYV